MVRTWNHGIMLVLLNQTHTRGRNVILSFPNICLSIFSMQLTKPSNCSLVMFVVGEVLCSAANSSNYAINCCKVAPPRSHVYTGAQAGGVNYNQGGGRLKRSLIADCPHALFNESANTNISTIFFLVNKYCLPKKIQPHNTLT